MAMGRWVRRGAAGGAGLFTLMLAYHLVLHGRISPRLGCVIGPEQGALNAPAALVEWVAPNPWVQAQRFGELPPPELEEPPTDRWSAPAWLACGALGYALLGAVFGAALGRGSRVRA
jgi:hypothetical protein